MEIHRIDSLDDSRLTPFRDLKRTNDTRWTGRFIVEGDKLVRRLLESDFEVESLLLSERYASQFAGLAQDGPTLVVADDWIERIVGFNFHRGILACARRKPPADLRAICQAQRVTLLVCPDVQDPENLGAILRISSAMGIDGLVLGSHCCDPFSRRVLRVSMGAALRVGICETADLEGQLAAMASQFMVERWAAVTDRAAEPFDRVVRPNRLALLLGSEGHGLAPCWLALCERRITIPMADGVDSLNVAVAAGVLLYHLTRPGPARPD